MGFSLGSSKSTTNSTSTTAPPAYIANAYQNIIGQAQDVAATPYTPYTGQLTAGLTEPQNQAIAGLGAAQGAYQPYYDKASTLADQSTTALTPMEFNQAAIDKYSNPYTNDVVNATLGDLAKLFGTQQTQVTGNAISAGAWGGDRAGIVKSNLANNQAQTAASTLANLHSQAYDKALSQFNTENQTQLGAQQQNNANALAASGLYQNLGTGASTNEVNLNNALLNAGTVGQTTNQAGLDAQYQQFLNQQEYPFQALSWLTGIATGVGSNAGNTTTGTSTTNETGFKFGASLPSDERLKEDIEPVGQLFDGQPIYRYRYKGDPTPRIGLIAQDVEQVHPEAVGQIAGLRSVDYGRATEDAAGLGHTLDMSRGDDGTYSAQGYAAGGDVPYSAGLMQKKRTGLALPISAPAQGGGPGRASLPQGSRGQIPELPSSGGAGKQDAESLAQIANATKEKYAPLISGLQPAGDVAEVAPQAGLASTSSVPSAGLGAAGDAVGASQASGLSALLPFFGFADGGAVDDEDVPLIFGPDPIKDQSRLPMADDVAAKGDRLPIAGAVAGLRPPPQYPESLGLAGDATVTVPDTRPAAPIAGLGANIDPVPSRPAGPMAGLGPAPQAQPQPSAGLGAGNKSLPRAMRLNNPGAIEDGPYAKSMPGYAGSDGRYAVFDSPEAGYGAMNRLLDTYTSKHGLNTVAGIINRWAPASSDNNDTSGYTAYVAKRLGVDPNAPIPPEARSGLAQAMAYYENGREVPMSGGQAAISSATQPRAGLAPSGPDQPSIPQGATPTAGLQPPQTDDAATKAGWEAGLLGFLTTGNIGQSIALGMQTAKSVENRAKGIYTPDERYAQLQAQKLQAEIEKARGERSQVVTNPNTGRSYLIDRVTGAKQLLDEGQTADLEVIRDVAGNPVGSFNKRTGAFSPLPAGAMAQPEGLPPGVKPTTDYDNWRIAKANGDTRTFAQYQEVMRKAGAPAGETAEESAKGKARGEAAAATEAAGRQAPDTIAKLDLLGGLLRNVNTGALFPTEAKVADWMTAFGLDPARSGLNPDAPMTAQVAQKIINELTVGMIGPGGFPANNFSDADRKFISDIFPKISNRPESNELALGILKKVQKKKLEYSDAWADYQEAAKARGEAASFGAFEREYRRQHRNEHVFGDLESRLGASSSSGSSPSSSGPAGRGGASAPGSLGDAVGSALGSSGAGGSLPRVNSPAEAMKLPPGTLFIDGDGRTRRVPERRP